MIENCNYKRFIVNRSRVSKVIILLVLCFVVFFINKPAQASDISVESYDELKEAIQSCSNDSTIILSRDIAIPQAISIADGKNLIIKSCDDSIRLITSDDSDYVFYLYGNSTLLLDRVSISSSFTGGVFGGTGTVSLSNSRVIPKESSDTTISKSEDDNRSFPHMDLASFIITWSGFALSFITIVSSVIAVLGIKEVRDLRKTREAIKKIEESVKESHKNVKDLEINYQKSLEDLAMSSKNEAHSIMFGTYYYSLGIESYKRGKYSDAITLLKQSLNYIQDNTDAICLIGRAKTFIGNKEDALTCYNEALGKDQNCASAYRGLAAYYRYTDLSKALGYANKAAELAPENTEILNYYGQLLRDDNKLSEARKVFLKSYGIQQHPDTNFFLSILYVAEDSTGRARIHIQEAIDGYQKEDEFGASKPVWLELAKWIQLLITDEDPSRFDEAIVQLNVVSRNIDSEKTRVVVKAHVRFVLEAIKQEEAYICKCEAIIDARD